LLQELCDPQYEAFSTAPTVMLPTTMTGSPAFAAESSRGTFCDQKAKNDATGHSSQVAPRRHLRSPVLSTMVNVICDRPATREGF
jgi:hypothetical protein